MENFAQSRSQHIFVFPAQHSQVKCTMLSTVYLEELLQQMDQGSAIPSSGLFLYTQEMPVMVLANICTLLGHVNGAHGIASGMVIDPTGKCFHSSSSCLSLTLKNSGVLAHNVYRRRTPAQKDTIESMTHAGARPIQIMAALQKEDPDTLVSACHGTIQRHQKPLY